MPQERDPEHGQVTVKVRAIGICGSDLHWYLDGRIGEVPAHYPRVPGHEPAGEVVAVGKGVEHLKAGDRVVIGTTGGQNSPRANGAHSPMNASPFGAGARGIHS